MNTPIYSGLTGQIQHKMCLARAYRYKNETLFIYLLRMTLIELCARNKGGLVFINPEAILRLIEKVHNIKRSRKTLYYSLLYLERRGEIKAWFERVRDELGKFKGWVYVVSVKTKAMKKVAGVGKWIRNVAKRLPFVGGQLREHDLRKRIEEEVQEKARKGEKGFSDDKYRWQKWKDILGLDVEKEMKKALLKGPQRLGSIMKGLV